MHGEEARLAARCQSSSLLPLLVALSLSLLPTGASPPPTELESSEPRTEVDTEIAAAALRLAADASVRNGDVQCLLATGSAGATGQALHCGGLLYVLDGAALFADKCDKHVCHGSDVYSLLTKEWFVACGVAVGCVLCAAVASGLTLGLTSLDSFQMRVLMNQAMEDITPSLLPEERRRAQRRLAQDQISAASVLPLISGHYTGPRNLPRLIPKFAAPTNAHYLLVTLLVCNAGANEMLPLVLDHLVPTWLAVVLSVTVVLVFGEIIPSAVFTGPNQLRLAARFAPFVGMIKLLMLPIAWPVSLLLDACLTHQEDNCNRAQIKALVRTLRNESTRARPSLDLEEAKFIHGVLDMHIKTALEISSPLGSAKMLPHDAILTSELVDMLQAWGHSRILLYRVDPEDASRRDDIFGVILVRKLIGVRVDSGVRLDSVAGAVKVPVVLAPNDNLLDTLSKFQATMCHLAILSEQPKVAEAMLFNRQVLPIQARPERFCTLEDVMEAILTEEIYDEDDAEQGKWRTSASGSFGGRAVGTLASGILSAARNACALRHHSVEASFDSSESD